MRCSILLVAPFAVPTLANWSLFFYESGCPPPGETSGSVSSTAGSADDSLRCIATKPAHNVVATNIGLETMEVTLFSDTMCRDEAFISTIESDGCKIIPGPLPIMGVRVVPKK